MPEYIVLATNTNHHNFAFGPFSDYEEARTVKFNMDGRDRDYEHHVLQILDHEKPLPTVVQRPYEQDQVKMALHEAAVEGMAEEERDDDFQILEQPDAPEEEEPDEDRNLDLGTGPMDDEDDDEDDDDEDNRTVKQLRERAAELEIDGRSSMDRDQLIEAIRAEEDEED